MVKIGSPAPTVPPKQQPDIYKNISNPVSATRYTILDTTPNVRLLSVMCQVVWTVEPLFLRCYITIDGRESIYIMANPASATFHFPVRVAGNEEGDQLLSVTQYYRDAPYQFEGRRVKVEVEVFMGTSSNLTCRIKWARWT